MIKEKIQIYEICSNSAEKIFKCNQAAEFIIIYFSIIYYLITAGKKLVNKELVEIILTNFYKKNPTTSSWIKLLKASLDLLKINTDDFNNEYGRKLQKIANIFLPDDSRKEIVNNPNLKAVLDSYQIIRNKAFAHGGNLNEEVLKKIQELDFLRFPYKLYEFLNDKSNGKFLVSENIPKLEDSSEIDFTFDFIDLSDDIKKNISISLKSEIDYTNIYSKVIYYYNKSENIFISASPFLLFRDGKIYYYNGIDSKQIPIFTDPFSAKNISSKKNIEAFKELVFENLNLLKAHEIKIKLNYEKGVYHNLPDPIFNRFIGRDDSLKNVLRALQNKRIFLIGISGIGGVGKSAFALYTARKVLYEENPHFSFIIWLSAKKTFLTAEGIKFEKQVFSNLVQLLDVILEITKFNDYLNFSFNKKKESVLDILSLDKFLIIVDNFETVDSPNEFLSFFEEVGDKCVDTKIIITTRHQLGSSEKIIDLKEFSINEYEKFVNYLIAEKFKLKDKLSKREIDDLYKKTGGLALATEFFIGQVGKNNPLNKILAKLEAQELTKESILEFSFKESFELLEYFDKKVLYSISLVDDPSLNKICFITGLDEFQVEEIIGKLKKISFVNINLTSEESKYSILPLTKTFLHMKLDKDDKLKNELITRLDEYKFITDISNQLQKEDTNFNPFSLNDSIVVRLAKAAYFLASQGNFIKSEEYFNQAVNYDAQNSMVWLQWALAERDFSNNIKEDYFEKAISYAHNNEEKQEIYFEWGKSYSLLNKHLQSIGIFNKYIELNPLNKNVHHFIGKAYYEIGRNLWKKRSFQEMRENYDKSIKAFLMSIYDNPSTHFEKNHNVIGYYFIAKIYRYYQDIGNSISYVKKGLDLQPNNFRLKEFAEELENLALNLKNQKK